MSNGGIRRGINRPENKVATMSGGRMSHRVWAVRELSFAEAGLLYLSATLLKRHTEDGAEGPALSLYLQGSRRGIPSNVFGDVKRGAKGCNSSHLEQSLEVPDI